MWVAGGVGGWLATRGAAGHIWSRRPNANTLERTHEILWGMMGWRAPPLSGGSAIGLSATGAWQILTSLGGAAVDDGATVAQSSGRVCLKAHQTQAAFSFLLSSLG